MVPAAGTGRAPVPPPAYHRIQRQRRSTLHLDALTLVTRLHLLSLCRLAVRLSQRRCPPPLPAGPGGRPRRYRDESLLLLALLHTLWRLSYQDLYDWLVAWPALALACGLPTDTHRHPRTRAGPQRVPAMPASGAGGRPTLRVPARRARAPRAPPAPHRRVRSRHRQRPHPGLAAARPRCGARPCPAPPRPPAPVGIPRPYATLSRLLPAPALLPGPCQLAMMRPSPSRCSPGPCASTGYAPALCAWTPVTGACA